MTQKAFDLALLVPDKDPVAGEVIRVKDPGNDFTTEFFTPVATIPNATAPGQTLVSDGANNWVAQAPGAAAVPYATDIEVLQSVEQLKALNPKNLADAATWRRTNLADTSDDARKYVRLDANGFISSKLLEDIPAVTAFDTTKAYFAGQYVVHSGALYVCTTPTVAGAFTATQWRDVSAAYVLGLPTTTRLGGVKATTPVAGQFVSGINAATGDLIFAAAPVGATGAQGVQGVQGVAGAAATVAVGTVTTGAAGSAAAVANSGTTAAATLDFTIPRGDKGDKGDKGDAGNAGAAATVAIGTVTTGAVGSSATVTNSGTTAAATFDFSIPQGAKGDKGDKGDAGPTYTLIAPTATTLGGVKATTRPTGKFVTGVDASGDFTFDFLPPAAATQLGGVKATANPGNQFVSGIAADGSLTFAAPSAFSISAATTAALGGIKLATRPADQFVTGFAADGTTQYAALPDVPVATAVKAGGVKATARPTGQFVIGVNTTGDLVYSALPALTAATATDLGGVKATAPVAGQFVTGIDASGDLTFAAPAALTIPAATAAALGGVKLATRPTGQFVTGFAADGTTQYAAVSVATTTAVGGIKATANPGAGNFVTGVDASGDLTFSNIIDCGTFS